jgi:hypothetical protein
VTIEGVWIVTRFIHYLYTRLGTTSNYRAAANFHNSQITAAPAVSFPPYCFFTSRSLATAYNSGDSLASSALVLCLQPPVQNSCQLSTQLDFPCCFLFFKLGTDYIENTVHSRMLTISSGMCLRHPATGCVTLSRICCPSNGRC